jgi:hypothetical protein
MLKVRLVWFVRSAWRLTCPAFTGYLTNTTINGQIAQQQRGATVVIEHRFYGQSNPYSDLSVASLKYLTIDQAINDLVFFAKNVVLPFHGGDKVSPAHAPWVLIGGSYSGALAAVVVYSVTSNVLPQVL